jgi:hypothetical protein
MQQTFWISAKLAARGYTTPTIRQMRNFLMPGISGHPCDLAEFLLVRWCARCHSFFAANSSNADLLRPTF